MNDSKRGARRASTSRSLNPGCYTLSRVPLVPQPSLFDNDGSTANVARLVLSKLHDSREYEIFADVRKRGKFAPLLSGPVCDVLIGSVKYVLPATLFAVAMALVLDRVDGSGVWLTQNAESDEGIAALTTLMTFLLTTRLNYNLQVNERCFHEFFQMCTHCTGLASQLQGAVQRDRKTAGTRPNGSEGTPTKEYQYDRVVVMCGLLSGMIRSTWLLASNAIPLDDNDVVPLSSGRFPKEQLVMQKMLVAFDSRSKLIKENYEREHSKNCAQKGKLDELYILRYFDMMRSLLDQLICRAAHDGIMEASVASMVLSKVADVALHEGSITSTSVYRPPRAMSILIAAILGTYFALLVGAYLAPKLGYNAVWLTAVISFSTTGVFGVVERVRDPFRSRVGSSRQRVRLTEEWLRTEIIIDQMLTASNTDLLGDVEHRLACPEPNQPPGSITTGSVFCMRLPGASLIG